MLNMRSGTPFDDRTARARIRDAALRCFADAGVAATSIRTIAAAADVSPALVIHHFGSKDALRHACDEYVAATIRERKTAAVSAGLNIDPLATLRQQHDGPPLLRYLARTLIDGSPHVAELVDEMVRDAAEYIQMGVDVGTLRPSAQPFARAALLTLWSLGGLVLHEHVERLLGVDLTRDDLTDESSAAGYILPALEIFSEGLIAEELAARYREAFSATAARPPPSGDSDVPSDHMTREDTS